MNNKEFIDLNLEDLKKSLPHLLDNSTGTHQFLGIFGGVAGAIVDAANLLGADAGRYATYKVGQMLLDFTATNIDRPPPRH